MTGVRLVTPGGVQCRQSPLLGCRGRCGVALCVYHGAFSPPDDVEFEVSSDRRTGKPIAVKLVKIKPEILPEERITGQVGPIDTNSLTTPLTVLHGFRDTVKKSFFFRSFIICLIFIFIII